MLASEAGIAALGEKEYRQKAVRLVREERVWLKGELETVGMQVWDGQADYLFSARRGYAICTSACCPMGF